MQAMLRFMFKRLFALSMVALLLMGILISGTACDNTSPKTEGTKVEKVVKDTKGVVGTADELLAARLMTVGSAIGALQHCRSEKIYVGNPDVIDDSFYRLATIMRGYADRPAEDDLKLAALVGFEIYKASLARGMLVNITVVKGDKGNRFVNTDTDVTTVDHCKMVEKIVLDARKSLLKDVPPAEPVRPPNPKEKGT